MTAKINTKIYIALSESNKICIEKNIFGHEKCISFRESDSKMIMIDPHNIN